MACPDERLDSMLRNFPELKAPDGFTDRLNARLATQPRPRAERREQLLIWGAALMASAAAMFIVIYTPVVSLVTPYIQRLGGLIQ